MKKNIFKITTLLVVAFLFLPLRTAKAHPADIYAHTITIALSQTKMQIEWKIKPGPLLVNFIWNEMDSNQDGTISEDEAQTWSASRLDVPRKPTRRAGSSNCIAW